MGQILTRLVGNANIKIAGMRCFDCNSIQHGSLHGLARVSSLVVG